MENQNRKTSAPRTLPVGLSTALLALLLCAAAASAQVRNYAKTYVDEKGQPLLQVEVTYLGKKPAGEYHAQHDWRSRDTDFYNVTFKNLTDQEIEFLNVETSFTKTSGPVRVETRNQKTGWSHYNAGQKEPLDRYWLKTKLAPGETWTRANKYVFGSQPTVAVHTYEIKTGHGIYRVQEQRTYRPAESEEKKE